jgi:thioredoxin reductase (NADPH)
MAIWDVLVIGGGASGLSAAATAARMGLSCLVIDRMGGGGELMNLGPLHGLDKALTGPDLAAQLLEDAVTAGAELEIGEVSRLAREGSGWRVVTDNGAHDACAVILAVGLAPGTLALSNEANYEGRGVSRCAACDGPLYHGLPVVVAGADRWAVQEAWDLVGFGCRVTLVTQGAAGPPAANGLAVVSGRILALDGGPTLEAVIVVPSDSTEPLRLPAQAVFVQSGRRPTLGFALKAPASDPDGRLIANTALQCDMPGLFGAGDARAGADRTLAVAMEASQPAPPAMINELTRKYRIGLFALGD